MEKYIVTDKTHPRYTAVVTVVHEYPGNWVKVVDSESTNIMLSRSAISPLRPARR